MEWPKFTGPNHEAPAAGLVPTQSTSTRRWNTSSSARFYLVEVGAYQVADKNITVFSFVHSSSSSQQASNIGRLCRFWTGWVEDETGTDVCKKN